MWRWFRRRSSAPNAARAVLDGLYGRGRHRHRAAAGLALVIAAGALAVVIAWPDGAAIALPLGLFGVAVAFAVPRPRVLAAVEADIALPDWLREEVRAVVDAVPQACLIVDRDETILYANRAAVEQLGPVRLGDPLSFKLRVPDFLQALEQSRRTDARVDIEWSEKVPTERWYEATIAPLKAAAGFSGFSTRERPSATAVFVRDLTEQRRLDRMREDFVSNASHELRTPLASLTGFVETLQGPARDDEAARARFLKIMLEQAERMRRLIDDLLSLSRIEMRAHVRPREAVRLEDVVGYAIDALRPLADEAALTVAFDSTPHLPQVQGDHEELVQVFENLIENAIKYGGSGGRVEITLKPKLTDPRGTVVCAVRDYGPGIPPQHLPRLTERFYRANEETGRASKRGTGLGLSIVKHIVTRHRGRLTIASEEGRGAEFAVELPADLRGNAE